jgi:nitrate reductase gamma subunit
MLLARRITLPQVRFLTDRKDIAILALCLFTLATGLIARFDLFAYDFILGLHMLSGEVILVLAPFTKLSHMALFFASRAQLGIDYAVKRGGASRGPAFPW